jgi:hypothetical protein
MQAAGTASMDAIVDEMRALCARTTKAEASLDRI